MVSEWPGWLKVAADRAQVGMMSSGVGRHSTNLETLASLLEPDNADVGQLDLSPWRFQHAVLRFRVQDFGLKLMPSQTQTRWLWPQTFKNRALRLGRVGPSLGACHDQSPARSTYLTYPRSVYTTPPHRMSYLPIAFAIAAVAYFAVVMVWPLRTQHGRSARRSVALVVLGDIGRSPRMVYHAQSFANAGFKTYILAYKGDHVLRSSLILHVRAPPTHMRTIARANSDSPSLRRLDSPSRANQLATSRVCIPSDAVGVGGWTAQSVIPAVCAMQGRRRRVGLAARPAVAGPGRARLRVCAGEDHLTQQGITVNSLVPRQALTRSRSISPTTPEQNPPAIPTLPLATLAAKLRGSRLVVDWHNTGYSILALRLGHSHPVVRIARWSVARLCVHPPCPTPLTHSPRRRIEHTFGRNAYAHLCVTEAMKSKLMEEVGLRLALATEDMAWL